MAHFMQHVAVAACRNKSLGHFPILDTLMLLFYMDIYDTRHTCYMPHATAAIVNVPEREMGNIRKSA